jgi:imidazoleglycerol phosphate dehydratase HisB
MNEIRQCSTQARNFLNNAGGKIRIFFAGHEEDGFKSLIQFAINQRHLEFVFEVGNRTQAAHDDTRALIGEFDVDLVHEFFQGFVNHAQVTLHIDNLRGDNAHHQCETVFKAFARALRMAAELDPRAAGAVPSTKGSL